MIIWKWLLRTLLTLIILIMLIVCFILTPYGFKTSVYIIEKSLPGQVHYQTISGMITGPITVKQLDYKDKGNHIHIDNLNFDWSPTSLFRKKLVISQLSANGITVITPPNLKMPPTSAEEKSIKQKLDDFLKALKPYQPQPLELPLSLEIDHAHASNLRFGTAENHITTIIKTITVNGVIYPDNINITAKTELLKPQPIFATLTARGSLKHYLIDLEIKDKLYHTTLHGEGNRDGATITIPKSNTLGGTLAGTIRLAWYPQIQWNINLQATNINPHLLDKQLPTSLDFSIKTTGKLINHNPELDFVGNLSSARATVNVEVHHHQQWNAKWNINIPRIIHIYSEAGGSFKSQGTLQGKLDAPTTSGSIEGSKLIFNGIHVGTIKGSWNLYFDNKTRSQLDMVINKLKLRAFKFDIVHINLDGHLLKHDILLDLNIGKHSVTLVTRAHYDGNTWTGVISKFTSDHNQFGNWKLRKPANFEYSPDKAFLKPLCLDANTGAFMCTHAEWTKDKPWNFSLQSKNFNFVRLEKKAMINAQFTSRLSINAHATGVGKEVQNGVLHMDISPGMLTYLVGTQVVNTNIRQSSIDVNINKKVGLEANLNLNVAVKDSLQAKLHIPEFTDYDIPMESKKLQSDLYITMHDFRFVTLLEHVLKVSLGRLKGHFTLTGTIGSPYLRGAADLEIPNFEYTIARVHAHNIKAHIQANGQKLTYNLVGYAFNKAPMTMKGETDLSQPHAVTKFVVATKNAEIIKNNQMDVYADATLNFLLTHTSLDIDGNVFIPKAKLSLVDFSNTLEMPKAHVEYIGIPKSKEPEPSHKINLHLDVKLGNDIWFTAFGLNARLAGGIVMKMSPTKGTIADGQVRIAEGTFQAYGQYLVITQGSSVSFIESPISNPFIDARAFKYVNTTTQGVGRQLSDNRIMVGVHIHGTLRSMQFGLYSQPPGISQADILSYLIFGYASGNGNAASLSVLMDAANAMIDSSGGLDQPVGLTDRLKQGLGIRELGVRNETVVDAIGNPVEDQSSFVVGDQLTKRIYVQFSRGLIIPDNVFTVQYQLNKNWKIQTETGSGGDVGTGADVLYTISTD